MKKVVALLFATLTLGSVAQTKDLPLVDAEVRKIDLDGRKLNLKHGEIKNLDMHAMTMTFKVAESIPLDAVKVGDKLKVTIEKVGGAFTVTSLLPAQ